MLQAYQERVGQLESALHEAQQQRAQQQDDLDMAQAQVQSCCQ